MTKYTAEFKDHTVSRNSDRTYTHAYLVTNADGTIYAKGFSGNADLAHKAANAELPRLVDTRRALRSTHARLAKKDGFATAAEWIAARNAEITARRNSMTIEVVGVSSC